MIRGAALALALRAAALALGPAAAAWTGASAQEESAELLELSRAPIDLNRAEAAELISLPRVSASTAAAMVERRKALGCLRSLDDLLGAGGLTELHLAEIRPYVTLAGGCPGKKSTSLRAAAAGWLLRSGEAAPKLGWAADLYLDAERLRTRLKARRGKVAPQGGCVLRFGGAAVILGDIRGRRTGSLSLLLDRGLLSRNGPLPCSREPEAPGPGLTATTGAVERIRGVGVELYGKHYISATAGSFLKPWGGSIDRAWMVRARLVRRGGLGIWAGASGWGRPTSGAAFASVSFSGGSSRYSMCLAARRSGGAWLATLCAAPGRGRRIALMAAGRWGGYSYPMGTAAFRRPAGAAIASRASLSLSMRRIGSIHYEEVIDSNDRVTSLERRVRYRKRLGGDLWAEIDAGGGGEIAVPPHVKCGLKLMWKVARHSTAELFYKLRRDDESSSLRGWRVCCDRAPWSLESGGFSFQGPKSLYLYEREILGRSSIKSLKGGGMGWYVCVRLDPPAGSRPLSLLGPVEIKIRSVLGAEVSGGGTFLGVQLGRR